MSLVDVSSRRWLDNAKSSQAFLFWPADSPSAASLAHIVRGVEQGLHTRYKTRNREPWWRVPITAIPDCFVSYMSASTPRIVRNGAKAINLNSTHGLRFHDSVSAKTRIALPLLSLNSISLMSAELVGRTYGGGVLKMEPREADNWLMPSVALSSVAVHAFSADLRVARRRLIAGDVASAIAVIDSVLDRSAKELGLSVLPIREASDLRAQLLNRRLGRASKNR